LNDKEVIIYVNISQLIKKNIHLQSAVSPGEFADLQANFSPDYAEIFAAGSTVVSQ
jgi:hypothetical protein